MNKESELNNTDLLGLLFEFDSKRVEFYPIWLHFILYL